MRQKTFRVMLNLSPKDIEYFHAAAQVRDISVHALVKRLMLVISTDDLILSILDDNNRVQERGPREHRYRPLKEEECDGGRSFDQHTTR